RAQAVRPGMKERDARDDAPLDVLPHASRVAEHVLAVDLQGPAQHGEARDDRRREAGVVAHEPERGPAVDLGLDELVLRGLRRHIGVPLAGLRGCAGGLRRTLSHGGVYLTHTARCFAILAISPSELRRRVIVTLATTPDKSNDESDGTILRTREGTARKLVVERPRRRRPRARPPRQRVQCELRRVTWRCWAS